MKIKSLLLITAPSGALLLSACSGSVKDTVKVGTIAGPETQLMQVAKKVAMKKYHLNVEIVTFNDYNTPNMALNDGSLDANAFQHLPFLKTQIKARSYKLAPVGKTFLYPMGLYSKKYKSLRDLPKGAEVAIPNDPSNESRALLLLQKGHLIKLFPGAGINATTHDIQHNYKHLNIVTLNAAQIPRGLPDVALAAINTNYAQPNGLSPKKALLVEGSDSPYVNLIVARTDNKNTKKIKELVEAFQSEAVIKEAKKLFGDYAIPGFKVKH